MKNYGLNVSYSRVSTDEQEKFGFSIIDQKNETENYAKMNGFEIDYFYVDDGYSASNLRRPDIQKLIREVAQDKIRCIVVRHSDRLIRNLLLQRSLQQVFTMYNTKVISISDSWDTSTPEKAFQSDLMGLLNEIELKKIRPRTIKGLRGSASCGNYSVGGKPPLGYRKQKNEKLGKGSYLVIHEEEAEIIVKIFNTLATNRVTVVDMVKYLNKNNILKRKWNEKSLFKLLDNEIYYGKFVQEWYVQENHSPAIISKELWEDVQVVIHHKKKETINFYLFKRVVYCKDCGCFTTLESSKKARKNGYKYYKYYKCPFCNERINESKIENVFENSYVHHKANVIDKHYIKDLEKKISLKKKRIEFLNGDFENELVDEQFYKEELKKLYREIKCLNEEILNFTGEDLSNFKCLTNMQKRALVLSNIEKIEISFVSEEIYIIYKGKK